MLLVEGEGIRGCIFTYFPPEYLETKENHVCNSSRGSGLRTAPGTKLPFQSEFPEMSEVKTFVNRVPSSAYNYKKYVVLQCYKI